MLYNKNNRGTTNPKPIRKNTEKDMLNYKINLGEGKKVNFLTTVDATQPSIKAYSIISV
jgi:hypothetical protein